MNTISSSNSDTTYSQGSSSAATASTVASTKEVETAATGSKQADDDNIQLSTRAQKIQKLNEEFFPGGPKSIRITPDFVARLHEYGLISAADADSLSPAARASSSEAESSLDELFLFTQDFGEELAESDPDNSLITTLNKAHSIIDAWEDNDPAPMTELTQVIAELATFNGSAELESLDHSDQKSMLELELAMNIAKKLNPQSNVSQEINSYMNILKEYRS